MIDLGEYKPMKHNFNITEHVDYPIMYFDSSPMMQPVRDVYGRQAKELMVTFTYEAYKLVRMEWDKND